MLREKEMLKDIFVWRSLVDQISGKERLARGQYWKPVSSETIPEKSLMT